jgi:hypothetical protein
MSTLVLNPFPIEIADLRGIACGDDFVWPGFIVIKEFL